VPGARRGISDLRFQISDSKETLKANLKSEILNLKFLS
jgi:hypothetical protein